MAGPTRPQGAELRRRIAAWGDEWRATAGSTARADRVRAEAALVALYAVDGREAPRVCWVPSPSAGMLAYRFAVTTHAQVRGRWARGDIGNGENRPYNALAAPFQMEPAWMARTLLAVRDRLVAESGPRPPGDPAAGATRLLGLGDAWRAWPFVQAAADSGLLDPVLPPLDPGPEALAATEVVLGPAWPTLAGLVGDELARSVVLQAVRNLTSSLLPPRPAHHWRGARRPEALQAMQPGQFDAITPVLAAARDVLGGTLWRRQADRQERVPLLDSRLELALSAGPWWALDGLAIVSERPLVVRRDDRSRFHAEAGPALAWADGTELFAWHGVRVDRDVVLHPERITVADIDGAMNAEVRRVLVERFGAERLVREGGATLRAEDETGRLWVRGMSSGPFRPREEPIVVVEVQNSTPEPDGSRRTYWLRVPPGTGTAREGVAWTFGMSGAAWRPAAES